MTILPSQVQRPRLLVEMAFGADPSGDPAGWAWADLSDRVLGHQDLQLARGRADESTEVQPSSLAIQLDNPDGALTPGMATSPWYPHVTRGVPARVSLGAGPTYLALPGEAAAYASTPDAPALDLADVIDLRVDIEPDDLTPGGGGTGVYALAAKGHTGDWSWVAYLTNTQLGLSWSTTGLGVGGAGAGAGSTAPPATAFVHGRRAFRILFDPDNGAGGRSVAFFHGPTVDGPWTPLGNVVTVAGTTPLHHSALPLTVGGRAAGSFAAFAGRIHAVQLRNGEDGPIVAGPDFADLDVGTTAFVDDAGRPWSLTGTAAIENWSTRLVGQVADITPSWPHGDLSDENAGYVGEARVDVTIAGTLRRLAQGQKPLPSAIRRMASSPENTFTIGRRVIAYWPLEDGADSSQGASAKPRGAPMTVGGSWRWAADDSLAGSEPLPSVSANEPAGWHAQLPPAAPPASGMWAVDLFVRIPEPIAGPDSTPLVSITTNGSVRTWTVLANDTALIVGARYSDDTPAVLATGGSGGLFGGWALLRFEVEQDGGNVDWRVRYVPLGTGTVFGFEGTVPGVVGIPTTVANLFTAPPEGISYGHVIVSDGLVVGWLAPADTAYVGETAGARIMRLCAQEGIPLDFVGDPDDTAPLGPQRVATLLELLREAAAADMGILYEPRRRLGLAYRTRRSLYNQPPRLVLDAATNDIANPFVPVLDDQRLRNDVTVARVDGSSVRLVDDESVAAHGLYDEQVDLNLASDDQLLEQAGWRLALGTWPGMRYPELTSELTIAPHLIDAWTALDIGDRVQVTNLPPQHPVDVVDLIVEAPGEAWSVSRITAQLTCSPGGPWDVGVLDSDGTPDTSMRRLATDGSELAAGVDADDTVLSVAVTGPRWTTNPAYFPLDVLVGGERMTVTAISGASSPQAFTVVRSVNGVAKAHTAGAAVQVANPLRLAL